MQRYIVFASLAPSLLVLPACVSHNIPETTQFVETAWPRTARVFVDANGDFYPDHWPATFPSGRIESRHSLRMAARLRPEQLGLLEQARREQLGEVAALIEGKRRVFLLVHGFNNDQDSAEQAFAVLRQRLPLTETDAVIQFHWDGLVGSWGGQAAMWFNATGYSQVAGTHALRDILRLLNRQHVVVIAHSRGASVVLSALSDPSYDTGFSAATENVLGQSFLDRPALAPAGNAVDIVLLAPAVGYPDFWAPRGERTRDCRSYRNFPSQVRSIRYTVNPDDPVLEKPLGGRLASSLNATDFGYDASVGRTLEACYNGRRPGRLVMKGYEFRMNAHPFLRYARHEVLRTMLEDNGVPGVRDPVID